MENRRIQRIDLFSTLDGDGYGAVYYTSFFRKDYLLLIDTDELYRLVGAVLSISTIGKYRYLKLDYKNYFHRLIMNPVSGEIVHHASHSNGDFDTLDCRKSHLIKMSKSEHSSIHSSQPRKRKVAAV